MKRLLITLCALGVVAVSCHKPLAPWEKGALETGEYRNVFLEAGYSQNDIDAKVDGTFNDLFFGKHRIYFEVGDTMGYVSDVKNNDVRTEGQSYGLMAAVQMGNKEVFDRIWRWTKHYMQHQEGSRKGYFAWSCKIDGTRNSDGAASDGELYFVTSLLFASNRWGNDTGINYKAEAQHILNCTMPKELSEEDTSVVEFEARAACRRFLRRILRRIPEAVCLDASERALPRDRAWQLGQSTLMHATVRSSTCT